MLTRDEFWALSERDREYYTYLGNGSGGGGTTGGLTNAELRATPLPVILPAGNTIESSSVETVSGSVAAGALNVTFVASSDFSGTVLGSTFLPGASITRNAYPGYKLGALVFTRAAGSLTIYKQLPPV